MKRALIVVLVVFLVIAGLFLAKDIIVKGLVSGGIKVITGLDLEIGSLKIGVFKPAVEVKGLKLLNPAVYPDRLMVDLPEFYADYYPAQLLKGQAHFRQLRLNLALFEVVKNKQGMINLDSLKALQPKGSGPAPKIRIDELVLDIKKVIYKDYSLGAKPRVSEFDVNIHETFRDVNDPKALASIIVGKALMHTTIADLSKFNLGPVKQEMESVVGNTGKLLKGTAGEAGKGVGNILKGLIPARN